MTAAFRDGGWDASAIGEVWPTAMAPYQQDRGIPAPGGPR
jgi:hypothetical protein